MSAKRVGGLKKVGGSRDGWKPCIVTPLSVSPQNLLVTTAVYTFAQMSSISQCPNVIKIQRYLILSWQQLFTYTSIVEPFEVFWGRPELFWSVYQQGSKGSLNPCTKVLKSKTKGLKILKFLPRCLKLCQYYNFWLDFEKHDLVSLHLC